MHRLTKFFLAIASIALINMTSSCKKAKDEGHDGWTIQGTITGANDSTLIIERNTPNGWLAVGTTVTDANGNFTYEGYEPYTGNQYVYRLRLADRNVFFPITTGTESLTLTASNTDMERRHKLAGSKEAAGFNTVDEIVNEAVERVGTKAALNDSLMLRKLTDIILADSTCIVSYYIVNHTIDNDLIFTPDDKSKARIIRAAANRYHELRPDDPYGQILTGLFKSSQIQNGTTGSGKSMEAQLTGRPALDFVRKNEKGENVDLNKVLDRGDITLVNIIWYGNPKASATTISLGDVYKKYHDKGLEIVQIGIDGNESLWRQNAMSMPWQTVFCSPADAADLLITYNSNPVEAGPSTFVFNAEGDLVSRVDNPAKLMETVESLYK